MYNFPYTYRICVWLLYTMEESPVKNPVEIKSANFLTYAPPWCTIIKDTEIFTINGVLL